MDEILTPPAAPQPILTLGAYIAGLSHALTPEDLYYQLGPLMREVASLHAVGRVANLTLGSVLQTPEGFLGLADNNGLTPTYNVAAIERLQPRATSALKVVGEFRVTTDEDLGDEIKDLRADSGEADAITRPAYFPNLRSWELTLGHHDELTDVFLVGMVMACLACGLDPADPSQIERFSSHRTNLFSIAPHLHPVIASLILETTSLNRHERATSLADVLTRLETYRDQPLALDIEGVLAQSQGVPGRRAAVLSHLRDRLFDLSRRNKLIHFRATQSSVNLTEASMPLVMRIESVRSELLCTWKGKFVDDVLNGKSVPLNAWLQFEDQPQLPTSFDRMIQETRRDRSEFGFSNLRLVVAFFNWHNLKESPEERICSPLVWLPVEVTKTKGVRDQFVMRAAETTAEFNPALRHMLRQLYNIELPEVIDLAKQDLSSVHADLERQIHLSAPGVRLSLQDRPQIQLIHRKVIARVNRFNRRHGNDKQAASTHIDFSYSRDDFRPRGHALFEKLVRPSPLPQRIASGGNLRPRPDLMVAETEALAYAKGGDDGHKYAWDIDLTQVTLANLNYKKMSLVRDYSELIDRSEAQPALDQVFSIEPKSFTREAPPPIPAAEQWSVVAADATQDAVVALARTNRSFIVQGPPGTGKSQTITNLIADFAAQGKRVLFVCEKRAALDVVYHRLGQAGLAGLACMIHDSQEDKKGFVLDLKERYEGWGDAEDDLERLHHQRRQTLTALDQHLSAIAKYDEAVGSIDFGPSLRALVRRASSLPPPADDLTLSQREALPSILDWDNHRFMAEQAFRTLRDRTHHQVLASHPFALLNRTTVEDERPISKILAAIDRSESLLQRLDPWLEGGSVIIGPNSPLEEAAKVAELAERLVATALAKTLSLLNPVSPESSKLQSDLLDIARLEALRATASEDAGHWRDPLSRSDTQAALALAKAKEKSFLRIFSRPWRDLHKMVQGRYDFSAHAVVPTVTSVLEMLAARHAAEDLVVTAEEALAERLQCPDLPGLLALRRDLIEGIDQSAPIKALLDQARSSERPIDLLMKEAQYAETVRQLSSSLGDCLDGLAPRSFDQVSELLRDLREALDDLPDLLPVLNEIYQADPGVTMALRTLYRPLADIEALVVDEAIARIERSNSDIRRFDIERLLTASRRSMSARERLRTENAETLKAGLHRQFRDHVKISEQSVTQLDGDGRAFKKAYSTGRRELEHEFGKSMRYRSIRDLASGESGQVVNDLKPVWLMSPLSVSDTLPLASDLFDVVIFDEASQIPTEEAVPALCRSSQVIIVGDEMQLPPTSFFSTALDEDDMQVVAEEDGERIAIILDADSLLNQAARNLPATLLAWHYRSRFEALISFSNAAFYGGQLVTIPDQSLTTAQAAPDRIVSDDQSQWRAGAQRVLAAPITTHRIADGLYLDRINLPEARYIAGMVRELLHQDTGQTIGIVAFSEAQQTAIESALDRLAGEDAAFAARLERELIREDDGQFSGLFVKNLENVQGDERDIILMSVCYAPGRDGRMVMNFGPINQRGGEKRLNVIFSRARRHMAIVSTIPPEAITNVHNDGARALRNFLTFAEAQSGGAKDRAQTILASVNSQSSATFAAAAPEDPTRDAIARVLQARGHLVHIHVGSASFRCDLAIVSPSGRGYALGILLDHDDPTGRAAEENFVFRPGVLRSFGWRVLQIPVAHWRRASTAVIDRIEAELSSSSWDLADSDPFVGVKFQPSTWAPRDVARPAAPLASPPSDVDLTPSPAPLTIAQADMKEFRMVEGSSNKFWRIGVKGRDVIVEFGRIGANGQRVIKTFESEERARREEVKLTLEKTRKGYEAV